MTFCFLIKMYTKQFDVVPSTDVYHNEVPNTDATNDDVPSNNFPNGWIPRNRICWTSTKQ
jgi:hypothetical protein